MKRPPFDKLGMSQQERDLADQLRAGRKALLLAVLFGVLALALFDLLERVPT